MTTVNFSISVEQLNDLLTLYPNTGKNSDVGKIAVEVAKLYFSSLSGLTSFTTNKKGIDLTVEVNGLVEKYEIKGTADKDISWRKLKVSSQNCHDHLVNGMTLIRITNIGSTAMTFHFLRYQEDFELIPEPRWSVVRTKKS
jgi:hypothetical protein